MVCKICGVDKVREMKLISGRYIYLSDNKQWHGKVCPVCVPKEKKLKRGSEAKTKVCDYCKKEFTTTRKNKVVCSLNCRNARRSKLEVVRQKIKKRQIKSIDI